MVEWCVPEIRGLNGEEDWKVLGVDDDPGSCWV